ncbi:DNA topoisomerase 2-binding protein 1 [Vitis vinifera]|uniref:DNA topoisomerase 2-binding protein 1 n=1 Tax=Vitis vinifera TaxID=29760 RepID=A0A438K3K4_VITVI|nr:DNA topoisomerase 2-binding protein 1 [Vitis vinifera]
MMMAKSLKGANVFMSRNLVPPELFDSLHDALSLTAPMFSSAVILRGTALTITTLSHLPITRNLRILGLRVVICSVRILNLGGPQCVLSCAKEHRPLPKQGFTCCLAMDGVKVLASGFDMDEKVKIGKLVTAMGGVLHTKASSDVSFVIVKNVLAAKYKVFRTQKSLKFQVLKWASNILKKPIVTINWLHQCWTEHRVVPQESYRVLPFSGLTICVTKIPAAPEGDKYKVARRWAISILLLGNGLINLLLEKVIFYGLCSCVNEESYTVQGGTASSINSVRTHLTASQSQDKSNVNFQSASSHWLQIQTASCSMLWDWRSRSRSDSFSEHMFYVLDAPIFIKEGETREPAMQDKDENKLDGLVADDSQTEDSDLYLSDCRILLVGFEASEMRKLVNMVRRGGGSRYMSFNEKLTHIVVGTPSEVEKKVVRGLAATGVISVVRTIWLEDCDHEKKKFLYFGGILLMICSFQKVYSACLNKGAVVGIINQGKSSTVASSMPADQSLGSMNTGSRMLLEKSKQRIPEVNVNGTTF